MVAEEGEQLYDWLKASPTFDGLFDEKDYYSGEVALLTAGAHRLLGNRELAERWLERADARFRHTVNPTPLSTEVAYVRLALRYDMARYEDVIELAPSLMSSFEKLGMPREMVKAGLLNAVALKSTGQTSVALSILEGLRQTDVVSQDCELGGRLLIDIGDIHQIEGRAVEALRIYQEALALLQGRGSTMSLADLKLVVGALSRGQGRYSEAIESFRASIRDFESLGMSTKTAYVRILVAESLLVADRPREAEWELLAALPTIEEQKMVPEGFAAVALLKESVRRRKTDPNALRELREHLQKSN